MASPVAQSQKLSSSFDAQDLRLSYTPPRLGIENILRTQERHGGSSPTLASKSLQVLSPKLPQVVEEEMIALDCPVGSNEPVGKPFSQKTATLMLDLFHEEDPKVETPLPPPRMMAPKQRKKQESDPVHKLLVRCTSMQVDRAQQTRVSSHPDSRAKLERTWTSAGFSSGSVARSSSGSSSGSGTPAVSIDRQMLQRHESARMSVLPGADLSKSSNTRNSQHVSFVTGEPKSAMVFRRAVDERPRRQEQFKRVESVGPRTDLRRGSNEPMSARGARRTMDGWAKRPEQFERVASASMSALPRTNSRRNSDACSNSNTPTPSLNRRPVSAETVSLEPPPMLGSGVVDTIVEHYGPIGNAVSITLGGAAVALGAAAGAPVLIALGGLGMIAAGASLALNGASKELQQQQEENVENCMKNAATLQRLEELSNGRSESPSTKMFKAAREEFDAIQDDLQDEQVQLEEKEKDTCQGRVIFSGVGMLASVASLDLLGVVVSTVGLAGDAVDYYKQSQPQKDQDSEIQDQDLLVGSPLISEEERS